MKEIDLRNFTIDSSPYYIGAPQPMYTCDSTEEWEKQRGEKYFVIDGIDSLSEYLSDKVTNGSKKDGFVFMVYKWNHELWVKTKEKFVPDSWSYSDEIIYKLDKGQLIPTDATYVQVFVIKHFGPRAVLYTSSGVYNVALGSWRVSSAIKPQFKVESKNAGKKNSYEASLNHVLNRVKPTVKDMRIFNLVFNPNSEFFGKFHKAAKKVNPQIRNADIDKYLTSKVFTNLMIKELSIMIPDLKAGMLKKFSPEKVSEMFNNMFSSAIDKGSIDDQRNVIKDILQVTYEEETSGYKSAIPLTESEKNISPKQIQPYQEKQATPEVTAPKPLSDKEKEALEKTREDIGSIEGYIVED